MESRIQELLKKNVKIVDVNQIFIAPEVDLERIYPESVLYPGVRLSGTKTLIGAGAKIGTEGPAVLNDTIVASNAVVASGFLDGAILLPQARAGANAHFRKGTLLEEKSSTAHTVGLKQTILLCNATLGSLINFCDVLMYGGISRKHHSEVGSSFMHFNFTPWEDKATPSLVGDVRRGVFLDKPPIFLGGMSGLVGPAKIGFGAVTVAGQVIRQDIPDEIMYAETLRQVNKAISIDENRPSERHIIRKHEHNIEYIKQLIMLKAWYEKIRLKRAEAMQDLEMILVYREAINLIVECIDERIKRYNDFAEKFGAEKIELNRFKNESELVEIDWKKDFEYQDWIRQLSEEEKKLISDNIFEKIWYN